MADSRRHSASHTTRGHLLCVLAVGGILLIAKTIVAVVSNFAHYFPPDFGTGFLVGRESYFFGLYRWAFYAHIVAGPASLLLGAVLLLPVLRAKSPQWHRRLGRVQGLCVITLVGPSGLTMAFWAAAGPVAGIGLGLLAVTTTACCVAGWRAAMGRSFNAHRRWMNRTYVLLCSAVVIRALGGAGTVLEITWPHYDAAITWASWVVPLAFYEFVERARQQGRRDRVSITAMLTQRPAQSLEAAASRVRPLLNEGQ